MPAVATSKLEAINTMLGLLTQAPITSLDGALTEDAATAVRILDEVDKRVQGRGWHWNTDKFKRSADANGRVVADQDWFRVDAVSYPNLHLTIRDGYLWDPCEGSDVLTVSELELKVVRRLAWESLPEQARGYILISAGRSFLSRDQDDPNRVGFTVQDERLAWQTLNRHEGKVGRHSIFDRRIAQPARRRRGGPVVW